MSVWPNSDRNSSPEVCVLGGGPAGAATALRLAQLGHRVCLVERGTAVHVPAGESMPPSLWPVLGLLGLRARVAAAGFLPAPPARVCWPGLPAVAHGMAPPPGARSGAPGGLQVDRAHFDAVLLQAAADAGVVIVRDSAREPDPTAHGWRVHVRQGHAIDVPVVVDARGRRGAPTAAYTVALVATWQGGAAAADTQTVVEAGAQGWAWTAPLGDGRTVVAVFLDASHCAGLRAVGRQALYGQQLQALPSVWAQLQGAQAGPVAAADATPRTVDDAAPQPGLLRVGEAAFSLDPLSSQGVPAALRSAWQAAACVHTALRRPEQAALAWQFHRQQSRRAAQRHARLAAPYYTTAAQAAAHGDADTFWRSRAQADAAPVPPPWPPLQAAIGLHPQADWLDTPVLEGDWVVPRPALHHPQLETPLAYLAGRPAADWLQALQGAPRLHVLLDRWHQAFGADRTEAVWPLLWRQGVLQARS